MNPRNGPKTQTKSIPMSDGVVSGSSWPCQWSPLASSLENFLQENAMLHEIFRCEGHSLQWDWAFLLYKSSRPFVVDLVVSLKIEYNTYRPTPILTDPSKSGISGGEEVSGTKKWGRFGNAKWKRVEEKKVPHQKAVGTATKRIKMESMQLFKRG